MCSSIQHLIIILCIFLSVLLVSSPLRNPIHRVILTTVYIFYICKYSQLKLSSVHIFMLQYTSQVVEKDVYLMLYISSRCESINTAFNNYSLYISLSIAHLFSSKEPYTSSDSYHSVFCICKYSQLKLSSVHIFVLQYTSQVIEGDIYLMLYI